MLISKVLIHKFCKHKRSSWYTHKPKPAENGLVFKSTRGEHVYLHCDDCGKQLAEDFWEYEGMGFK